MLLNQRLESDRLTVLRLLMPRTELPETLQQYYYHLEKGFEGEKKFDDLLKNALPEVIILTDLLLEVDGTTFQIDTLLIIHHKIYLFEVKNYQGDYVLKNDQWLTTSGKEIKNPLLQLKRSESLLRQLLQSIGATYTVESYLVLINPEFFLYQAPFDNLPIIFPSQLHRFIQNLQSTPSSLNQSDKKLANYLLNKRIKESMYRHIIDYHYDDLKKGITCPSCQGFMARHNLMKVCCPKCNFIADIESSVLRSIKEFSILFPNKKVTVNIIHDWCNIIYSKKTIRKILNQHFTFHNTGKTSFFT